MTRRPTPDQDLEHLLAKDGGEFGAVYARLSRPEPPRRLDRIVLANAARAVHGGRAPRAHRWALAMGSVTGVVLAAGIAWQVGKQMDSAERAPEGSREWQDSRVVPVEAITEPRPREKAKRDLIMRESDSSAGSRQEQSGRPGRTLSENLPSAPAPVEPRDPPATARPNPIGTRDKPTKTVAPQAAPAAPAAPDQVRAEAFPVAEDAALGATDVQQEPMQEQERKSGSVAAGKAAPLQSRSTSTERPPAAAGASPVEASPTNLHEQLAPGAWIEEIERLLSSDQRVQAIEELRAFRKRYPDWPLPDALRQLDP